MKNKLPKWQSRKSVGNVQNAKKKASANWNGCKNMEKSRRIFISLVIFGSANVAVAQEGFLCVSEAYGGVAYDEKKQKWGGAIFRNDNEKFLISKKSEAWMLRAFNSSIEVKCKEDINDREIYCSQLGGEFRFNPNSKRYIKSYLWGYTNGTNDNKDTPNVQIGSCIKL